MAESDPRACVAAALRAHRGALRRYVASRVPPGDVEDVLQIAALRAIERARDLKDAARVKPWLYRIHANIVVDLGRKKAAQRRLLEALAREPAPEPAPETAAAEPGCGGRGTLARRLNANHGDPRPRRYRWRAAFSGGAHVAHIRQQRSGAAPQSPRGPEEAAAGALRSHEPARLRRLPLRS